jgi:hypothetical protein
LAGQHDDGLHLNDAINFVNEHGCATLQTTPLTPDDEASDSGAEREARIYRPWGHKRVTSLAQIRRHVRNGFPVILVIRNDQVFNRSAALSEAFQWQKTKAEMEADFNRYGPHAICAVGYDDAKQAVLVVNSLGTDWKDGGYCWVHYNNLATIPTVRTDESETWCLEAHVIQVKEELPASVLMKHRLANVRFKLDQQHKVFNDTRRLSPITWKIQDIACNDHTVFLLRDDHLVARLNKIVDVLEDDADAVWTHLTRGLPANSEVTMIAATTGTSVHALTRGGELFNFDSDSGKWKQVTIPNSENAAVIDLRDGRSHGPLSVTTIRGRVFEFDLDEGWLEK